MRSDVFILGLAPLPGHLTLPGMVQLCFIFLVLPPQYGCAQDMPIDLGGEQEDSEGETLSASMYRNKKAQHVGSKKGDFVEPGAIVTTKKIIFTLQHQEIKISNFYNSIGVLL